jgi:hypothetical protein
MTMVEMTKKTRDGWDKLDIILKFAGGVMTALAVALVGLMGSRYLAEQQDIETNTRLYTELMSRREEADTSKISTQSGSRNTLIGWLN